MRSEEVKLGSTRAAHRSLFYASLGILVGQAAAHSAADRLAGEILAGDQFHRCFLPPLLHGNIVENLGCHTHLSPRIVLFCQQLYHILCPMQAPIVK